MRIAPDGKTAYIALSTGKGLGMLELSTNQVTVVPLQGQGIQAGVTPNGRLVTVSVYDKKNLAIYDVVNKKLTYADLPDDAKGPVQCIQLLTPGSCISPIKETTLINPMGIKSTR